MIHIYKCNRLQTWCNSNNSRLLLYDN